MPGRSTPRSFLKQGKPDEAIAAIRKTVELSTSDKTNYLLAVANVCMQAGRWDEALKHAELAISRGDSGGYEVKARAYLAQNDVKNAEEAAKKSIQTRPSRKRSYLILAELEARRGNLEAAFQMTEDIRTSAKERDLGGLAGFHFLRGDLLARMNRTNDAKAEFLEETRLFPSNLLAWQGLAAIYASERNLPETRRIIEEMVAKNPTPASYAGAVRTLIVLQDQNGAQSFLERGRKSFPSSPLLR